MEKIIKKTFTLPTVVSNTREPISGLLMMLDLLGGSEEELQLLTERLEKTAGMGISSDKSKIFAN